MLRIRKSEDRGHADHGWLQSHHSFSFAGYHDPAHVGWGNLRVINDDLIAAGGGFGMHGHRDMEIISYVTAGLLAHKDSLGNGTTIPPGDVQRMSAGSGVRHSEFNQAPGQSTHLLQIWIEPCRKDIEPGYEQKHFPAVEKRGRLRLIASPDGAAGSLTMHADAAIHAGLFDGAESASLPLDAARKAYVHVVRGSLVVNGQLLHGGDAALLADEEQLELGGGDDAEVLVFDLAP
ncbi:MAG TPA: pirin family protein [Candidatus Accumulibacter phosphatis]|nr:quercetin 2,3-dioxygenase [Accumulibacter sp.]HCN69239.1 quercetin 2,3-dioxygenase [Accumulibacter sp.]HCV13418.1 quercetin 2,3-dioxygenase [Accumulibacter sp.]HRL75044.1 pirin family protein [Candidatus Accumulibacter phosphatis]HRQ93590.1 pirin family protein [Candidatus Accumulibacter phosphatis]